MIEKNIESFGEIFLASLVYLFTFLAIVGDWNLWFLIQEFFTGIRILLQLCLLHFGQDFTIVRNFDVEWIFGLNKFDCLVHEFF